MAAPDRRHKLSILEFYLANRRLVSQIVRKEYNRMESTQKLASRWKRLAGVILDCIILIAMITPIILVAAALMRADQGLQMSIGSWKICCFVIGLAGFLLVNGYLLAKQGQTVGKKLVGIRIVSHVDEHIVPLGTSFGLRYLPLCQIAQVPIIGNIFTIVDTLFIFRDDKRCIHDLIAGTKVVDA